MKRSMKGRGRLPLVRGRARDAVSAARGLVAVRAHARSAAARHCGCAVVALSTAAQLALVHRRSTPDDVPCARLVGELHRVRVVVSVRLDRERARRAAGNRVRRRRRRVAVVRAVGDRRPACGCATKSCASPGCPRRSTAIASRRSPTCTAARYTPPARASAAGSTRLNALDADLVAVTGDLITTARRYVEAGGATRSAGCAARDGVFACMGNHDYFTDGEQMVARARAARADRAAQPRRRWSARRRAALRRRRRRHLDRARRRRARRWPTARRARRRCCWRTIPSCSRRRPRAASTLTLSGHTHGGQLARARAVAPPEPGAHHHPLHRRALPARALVAVRQPRRRHDRPAGASRRARRDRRPDAAKRLVVLLPVRQTHVGRASAGATDRRSPWNAPCNRERPRDSSTAPWQRQEETMNRKLGHLIKAAILALPLALPGVALAQTAGG